MKEAKYAIGWIFPLERKSPLIGPSRTCDDKLNESLSRHDPQEETIGGLAGWLADWLPRVAKYLVAGGSSTDAASSSPGCFHSPREIFSRFFLLSLLSLSLSSSSMLERPFQFNDSSTSKVWP